MGEGLGEGDVADRMLVRNRLLEAGARTCEVTDWVVADEALEDDSLVEETDAEASEDEEVIVTAEKLGKAPPTLATPREV